MTQQHHQNHATWECKYHWFHRRFKSEVQQGSIDGMAE